MWCAPFLLFYVSTACKWDVAKLKRCWSLFVVYFVTSSISVHVGVQYNIVEIVVTGNFDELNCVQLLMVHIKGYLHWLPTSVCLSSVVISQKLCETHNYLSALILLLHSYPPPDATRLRPHLMKARSTHYPLSERHDLTSVSAEQMSLSCDGRTGPAFCRSGDVIITLYFVISCTFMVMLRSEDALYIIFCLCHRERCTEQK